MLPDDLKDYTEDAFSLFTPDQAVAWICGLIAFAALFPEVL